MPVRYSFGENGEFIVEGYDKAKTFAGFLPGIAGVGGIPAWSFYVNRGQALGSFGVKDKNGAIMEFFPANTMYRNIERQGFRTFIRKCGEVHEIFSSVSIDEKTRSMTVEKNIVKVTEINLTLRLKVSVTYFTMPGEDFAALVRKVEIENLGQVDNTIEILDGLPQILPAGVANAEFQAISNLVRAWFDVTNVENGIAYYRMRGTTADTAEVGESRGGNFYLSFSSESGGLIRPIYDMDVIFGENTALSRPDGWDCPAEELAAGRQVPENKVSGGFSGARTHLRDKFVLFTVIGHAVSPESINMRKGDFTPGYMADKEKEARSLVDLLVGEVSTKTSNRLFDQYIGQSYLDNLLRGGYPLVFKAGGKNLVYHVFSRKHGDLEREYNFFSLEPSLFSQGNGNYRDVNQNRRNDVLVKPEVGDFNVKHLLSLIQADGYNPLLVKGCTFSFEEAPPAGIPGLLQAYLDEAGRYTHAEDISKLLGGEFTPGSLISFIVGNKAMAGVPYGLLLEKVLEHSRQNFRAEFGEGYWSDHWTYNMDLVDTYLVIFPDRREEFLFGDNTYRYFYSPAYVLPRSDRYVTAGGKVRQYGAVYEKDRQHPGGDMGKASPLKVKSSDKGEACWLRTENGDGSIYETNLFAKLICLALTKFVNLDPCGMGIEMEAGRPGWNDAMNGLPGLFGSGVGETAELKRMVSFLINAARDFGREVKLFAEAGGLLKETVRLLERNLSGELDDFSYWDLVSCLKEDYRSRIRFGIIGAEESFSTGVLLSALEKFYKKLEMGLEKALSYGNGIYPTYFSYQALDYEIIEGRSNPVNGYRNVKIRKFRLEPLPLFLEGPARVLKTMKSGKDAEKLYEAVKSSGLYDRKLKMYKSSAPLAETADEIGRIKAFTPGWLEREAIFVHMEYKYLYSMLAAGLYEQFYEDMETALIPFLKPETYGRSTAENSSFIASSANPDPSVHGRGFVARMSGSTAEMLSMWFFMMAGREPFRFGEGGLMLKLEPVLPGWLFDESGRLSFRFLGKTMVTYINAKRANTFRMERVRPVRYEIAISGGSIAVIEGDAVADPYARAVRSGEIEKIDVILG